MEGEAVPHDEWYEEFQENPSISIKSSEPEIPWEGAEISEKSVGDRQPWTWISALPLNSWWECGKKKVGDNRAKVLRTGGRRVPCASQDDLGYICVYVGESWITWDHRKDKVRLPQTQILNTFIMITIKYKMREKFQNLPKFVDTQIQLIRFIHSLSPSLHIYI